ncbi:hypothetical protein C8R46DRAFT_1220311 [Mycena filopes]|nr:hypothetical protein C8R46DRAFT_1220311 [Mycena filopes]
MADTRLPSGIGINAFIGGKEREAKLTVTVIDSFLIRTSPSLRRSFDTLLRFLGSSPSWRTALVLVPSYTTAIEFNGIHRPTNQRSNAPDERSVLLYSEACTDALCPCLRSPILSLCGVKDTQEPGTGPDSMTQKEVLRPFPFPWSDETSLSSEWNTVSLDLKLYFPQLLRSLFSDGNFYWRDTLPRSCHASLSCKKATGIRISMDYILVMLSEVCSLDAVPQLPASARPVPAKALGFRPPGWISESTRAAVMRSDSLVYQLFSNSLGVRTLRINGPLAPPRQAVRSELRAGSDLGFFFVFTSHGLGHSNALHNHQASTHSIPVSAANPSSPFTWTDMPWAAGDDSDQTVLSTDA